MLGTETYVTGDPDWEEIDFSQQEYHLTSLLVGKDNIALCIMLSQSYHILIDVKKLSLLLPVKGRSYCCGRIRDIDMEMHPLVTLL